MQTALAASDAKLEVLHKYEFEQMNMDITEVNDQVGDTEVETIFQPPP